MNEKGLIEKKGKHFGFELLKGCWLIGLNNDGFSMMPPSEFFTFSSKRLSCYDNAEKNGLQLRFREFTIVLLSNFTEKLKNTGSECNNEQ